MRVFKVGGMRFLRIGKLQFSFCVCRAEKPAKRKKTARLTAAQVKRIHDIGYAQGCSVWPERLQIANH